MATLGIGIITYNRREALQQCLERLRAYTQAPYQVVVADDGSTDGTAAWLRSQGTPVVTGERRGAVWNRNRALAYLMDWTECDPILLLDDDGWPNEPAWEGPWIEAADRWGHISWALQTPGCIVGGSGTAADPYQCKVFGGLCVATARAALWAVGYQDTRFRGYGHGHVEWTYRFARLLGPRWSHPVRSPRDVICPGLDFGIYPAAVGSWVNRTEMVRNERTFRRLLDEPIWRPAARDECELQCLGHELGEALGLPPQSVIQRLRPPVASTARQLKSPRSSWVLVRRFIALAHSGGRSR